MKKNVDLLEERRKQSLASIDYVETISGKIERANKIEEKLEKIKIKLSIIKNEIQNSNLNDLIELEINCENLLKHANRLKKYLHKRLGQNTTNIKELIKEIQKVKGAIKKKKDILLADQEEIIESKINFDESELEEITKIVNSDISDEEKEKQLGKIVIDLKNVIDQFSDEISWLKIEKKKYRDYREIEKCRELDIQIKQLYSRKTYFDYAFQKCKSNLAYLRHKDVKVAYPKNHKIRVRDIEENKGYFLIIHNLLIDDNNYLFLKEILDNEAFFTARYGGYHIIFEILDKYIYNTKMALLNQKMSHINPQFYYEILKIYLEHELELSEKEKELLIERLAEFVNYIHSKGYTQEAETYKQIKTILEIKKELIELLKENRFKENRYKKIKALLGIDKKEKYQTTIREEQETIKDSNDYSKDIKQIMNLVAKDPNRVNLISTYLEEVASKIARYQTEHPNGYTEEEIIKELSISKYDIKNSTYPSKTYILENQKYAYNLGYDKDYNLYIRIHVLDTSFIHEDSALYDEMRKNMEQHSLEINKDLKFQEGRIYPTMTYQFKIKNKQNAGVGELKCYPSVIQIDKTVTKQQFKDHRDDEDLKQIVGCLKYLATDYNLPYEVLFHEDVEKVSDDVLNIALQKLYKEQYLEGLYYTEFGFDDAEKEQIQNQICYYLGKIPKDEAHVIYNKLVNLDKARCYSTVMTEEGKLELDTRTYLGYYQLQVLQLALNGQWTDEQKKKYQAIFADMVERLNKDKYYISYIRQNEMDRKKVKLDEEYQRTRELSDSQSQLCSFNGTSC